MFMLKSTLRISKFCAELSNTSFSWQIVRRPPGNFRFCRDGFDSRHFTVSKILYFVATLPPSPKTLPSANEYFQGS